MPSVFSKQHTVDKGLQIQKDLDVIDHPISRKRKRALRRPSVRLRSDYEIGFPLAMSPKPCVTGGTQTSSEHEGAEQYLNSEVEARPKKIKSGAKRATWHHEREHSLKDTSESGEQPSNQMMGFRKRPNAGDEEEYQPRETSHLDVITVRRICQNQTGHEEIQAELSPREDSSSLSSPPNSDDNCEPHIKSVEQEEVAEETQIMPQAAESSNMFVKPTDIRMTKRIQSYQSALLSFLNEDADNIGSVTIRRRGPRATWKKIITSFENEYPHLAQMIKIVVEDSSQKALQGQLLSKPRLWKSMLILCWVDRPTKILYGVCHTCGVNALSYESEYNAMDEKIFPVRNTIDAVPRPLYENVEILETSVSAQRLHPRTSPMDLSSVPVIQKIHPRLRCHWKACGKRVSYQHRLDDHIFDIHTHPSQPVRCPHVGCAKDFISMDKWRKHSQMCCPMIKQICSWPGCNRRFPRSYMLKQHIKDVHSEEIAQVCCSFDGCERLFSTRGQMMDHRRCHTRTKCSSCGKGVARADYQSHRTTCSIKTDRMKTGLCIGSRWCTQKLNFGSLYCETHWGKPYLLLKVIKN